MPPTHPSIAFATPVTAPGWQRWLVYSPVARIVAFAALLVVLILLVNHVVGLLGWTSPQATQMQGAAAQLFARALPALLAYGLLVHGVERRRVVELAPTQALTFGLPWLLAGAALFSVVVALLWLMGSYHVLGRSHDVPWLDALLSVGLAAGIGEEIITRGALFRITEEGLGTTWAMAISALFFGAAHWGNPGATWWSSLAIAIEAGLLLAMIYVLTRSLWPCIGLHAAWNLTQGTVYGIPVSGLAAKGFVVSKLTGPTWLSGGGFGAEASLVAVVVCSLATCALWIAARRRGRWVAPSWRRTRLPTV